MSGTRHHNSIHYDPNRTDRRHHARRPKNPLSGLTPIWSRETWEEMNDLAGVNLDKRFRR